MDQVAMVLTVRLKQEALDNLSEQLAQAAIGGLLSEVEAVQAADDLLSTEMPKFLEIESGEMFKV